MRTLSFYVLCGLLIMAVARPAKADIRDLLRFLQPSKPGAPGTVSQAPVRRLLLNGYPLEVVSGRTAESPRAVIDFYEQRYRSRGGAGSAFPTFRQDEDGTSVLATADSTGQSLLKADPGRGRGPGSATIPPLCLVFAQVAGDMTSYFAMFTEGAVPAAVISPPRGHDAPGGDVPGIPRPYNSYRSYSLAEPQTGYAMVSYVMDLPPEQAFQSTIEQLRGVGFSADSAQAQAAEQAGFMLLYLNRKGQDLMLTATPYVGRSQHSLVMYVTRSH